MVMCEVVKELNDGVVLVLEYPIGYGRSDIRGGCCVMMRLMVDQCFAQLRLGSRLALKRRGFA
jgi:hypothetical protein